MVSVAVQLAELYVAHAVAAAAASLSHLASANSNEISTTTLPLPSPAVTSTPDILASQEDFVRLEDVVVRVATSETIWMTPCLLIAGFLIFWLLFFSHLSVFPGDSHAFKLEDAEAEQYAEAPEIRQMRAEVTKNSDLMTEVQASTESEEQAKNAATVHLEVERAAQESKLDKAAEELALAHEENTELRSANAKLKAEMMATAETEKQAKKHVLSTHKLALEKVARELATASAEATKQQEAQRLNDADIKYCKGILSETRTELANTNTELAEEMMRTDKLEEAIGNHNLTRSKLEMAEKSFASADEEILELRKAKTKL